MNQRHVAGRPVLDSGYTLVEIVIVLGIVTVLLFLGLPTFVSARARADDRATQARIREALVAERSVLAGDEGYTDDLSGPGSVGEAEPSLTFAGDGPVTSKAVVYVDVTAGVLTLGARSHSGTCFYLRDEPDDVHPVRFARDTACPAPSAASSFSDRW